MCSCSVKTHLGNELIDEDHNADSANKAAQKRATKDRVEKAKSAESSDKDKSSCKTSHHACHLCVPVACLVPMVACIDGFADDLACQQ